MLLWCCVVIVIIGVTGHATVLDCWWVACLVAVGNMICRFFIGWHRKIFILHLKIIPKYVQLKAPLLRYHIITWMHSEPFPSCYPRWSPVSWVSSWNTGQQPQSDRNINLVNSMQSSSPVHLLGFPLRELWVWLHLVPPAVLDLVLLGDVTADHLLAHTPTFLQQLKPTSQLLVNWVSNIPWSG